MQRQTDVLAVLMLAAGAVWAQDQQVPPPDVQIPAEVQGQFNQLQNIRGPRSPAGARGARSNIHQPYQAPLTAKKIQTAIDDGVLFLRSQQGPDGSWQEDSGQTVLAVLALLAAGGDPASNLSLRKGLDWLAKREDDNTYIRGLRANAWEYALRKVPYDEGLKQVLKKDYDWLLEALGQKEGWRYNLHSTDWDNSCTQYGVLGLWAAARAGFDPGDAFWKKLAQHFLACQSDEGGWVYTGRGGGSPNMATAGLASMFLVFDMYHGKSFYSAATPRAFAEGEAAACLLAIRKGMDWLGKNHQNGWQDGYFLYGIERTGVASGRKYIGGLDWFREGAEVVLRAQDASGAVHLGQWGPPYGGTAFSILFLVYGGAPVAYNKLEYGDTQDWNLNPRDLANVAKHLWSAYERPLNWHAVSIRAPASEFEAPILFISGSQPAVFKDEEVKKLREYVERGGTILAEGSDRSAAFDQSMEALVRRMFPKDDFPAYELKPLPPGHGIYTVLKQDWKERPELLGVSDGARTFFLLSKGYLSADWQMNRTETDAFKLAMNLLFYATDLGTLEGKFASGLPETPPAKGRDATAVVARIRHGTGASPRDWAVGAQCWPRFAPYLQHISGCRLEEKPGVNLAQDDLSGVKLLHLTGREAFEFSDAERAALKKYVQKGGTLLVDAYGGAGEFATAARREMEALFGKLTPLDPADLLATGQFEGGANLGKGVQFTLAARRSLRDQGLATQGQKLEVARAGKRAAVFFSRFDLTGALGGVENYQSAGYKAASARKIAGNLLAYVMVD